MFLDPTGTVSVSLPAGWAFDPLSSSLSDLTFIDWTAPSKRRVIVHVCASRTDAGATDNDWETAITSRLPVETSRIERRDGPVVLAECAEREARPPQRRAVVRGPRFDTVIEQEGAPPGGALLTNELAEALRSLDVPVNRFLGQPKPESEFEAVMIEANQAFHAGDPVRAIRGLADAREIARDTWLHSLISRPLPNVPAVIAEAEAMLAQARVASSTLFLRDATLSLQRARATLSGIRAASRPTQMQRLDNLLDDAWGIHGERVGEAPPRNPFAACAMRVRSLLQECDDALQESPKMGGPWATIAVEDAMTAVAFAVRGMLRTVSPDTAEFLAAQGITDETEQLVAANSVFTIKGLELLVSAAGRFDVARVLANRERDRTMNENWLLAARRLVELSPSREHELRLVMALSGVVTAYVSLGDDASLDEAQRLIDEAQRLLDNLGDEGEFRAQICLNQGWLRHSRRVFDGTIPILDRAIAAAERSGAARIERAARSLRSQFLLNAGRHDEAVAEARRALDETHDDAASTHHLNLAVALHRAGDELAALDEVRAGLAAALADDPLGEESLRLLFVGAALLDPHDAAGALDAMDAAEAVLDARRLRLNQAADRIGYDDAAHSRELAATLVQRRLAAGYLLDSLATADRHRARSLADAVDSRSERKPLATHESLNPPAPDASFEEQVSFISRAAALELSRQGIPAPLAGPALADVINEAGRAGVLFHPSGDQMLIFVVRPGQPVQIGTATAVPTLTRILALTDALRAQLGIVVSARAARGEAPQQSFEDLVSALADDNLDEADEQLDRLRHELHDALFSEVAPLLEEGEPIVVVPYRELAVIPLSVLTSADGRSMAERHPLSVLPSLASFRALAYPQSATATAVVIGDPAVDPAMGLGRLPNAASEAKRVAASLREAGLSITPLLHEDATESAFRLNALDARVVHLACHAAVRRVAGSSPLFLTPTPQEDGLLLPDEIADLRLDGALVVLAACQSGLGRATADGVLGLGRAFIQAGARAVVLSLWRVSDPATAQLMESFYDALVGKGVGVEGPLDVAAAMRHAQLLTSAAVSAHPSTWGAWLVVGDGGWRLK